MMKLILQFLIRYYVNRNKEIVKLSDEEELEKYQFKGPSGTFDILKNNITIQTLRHFEAKSEQERWMVKGAALWLQLMKDRHTYAVKLQSVKDKKKRIDLWRKFKLTN